MNDQIVSRLGYTHGQLNEAFKLIQNPEHWKLPIDAWIHPNMFEVCNEACVYFTGGPLYRRGTAGDAALRVTADGYYQTIGA